MSVWDLLVQEYCGPPDWYHVSGRHWVMDLGWYKKVRRYMLQFMPDAESDEDKWVPGPDDTIFGFPVEVREDGGQPHLVSADHEAAGRLLQAIFATPEHDGPPYTHTLKLPETEEEMRAEEEAPSFTLEEGQP